MTPAKAIPAVPGPALPEPEVSLYYTGTGQRYHYRDDCYGLRNSRRVIRADLCPVCVPRKINWRPQGQLMFGAAFLGPCHADAKRCEKEHGYSDAYRPCAWCVEPTLSGT